MSDNPKVQFACPRCELPIEVELQIDKIVDAHVKPDGKLAWQADLSIAARPAEPHKPRETKPHGPTEFKSGVDNLM